MYIAILMTNTDDSQFASKHPTDDQKFIDILGCVRPDWLFETFNVTHNKFPDCLKKFDGFIITGSPASVNDENLWIDQLLNIIRDLADLKIPLFGSCFGHQVIAKAFGSKIVRNPDGWSLGLVETDVIERSSWMSGLERKTLLHSAHIEQVSDLPRGAKLLFKSNGCNIAGFAIGNGIFTTQYHPEMRTDFVNALIKELETSVDTKVIKKAFSSMKKSAHTLNFSEAIAQFFEVNSK